MKISFWVVVFLVSGCASTVEKHEVSGIAPDKLPLSDELDFKLSTACPKTGGDYEVRKSKSDPCLFIDEFHVCTIKTHSLRSKVAVLALTPGMSDPPRFGAFREVKKKETLKAATGTTEMRDTCDLQFEVERAGKVQRCHYNRHHSLPDIYCP